MYRKLLLASALLVLTGCGGVSEVPPADEGEPEMSQEEQQRMMEESMQRGGRSGSPNN